MFIITITDGDAALETYGPFDTPAEAHSFIDSTFWCKGQHWLVHELIDPYPRRTTEWSQDQMPDCSKYYDDPQDIVIGGTEDTVGCDSTFFYDQDFVDRVEACDRCCNEQYCEDHDGWGFCSKCGVWREIDEALSGTSPGYTGAGIDWWGFKGCSHQEVDASADTIEAVR